MKRRNKNEAINISNIEYRSSRILMEEIKVTPSESILHQVRGLSQDIN